jgi:UDP-N-acetylmuramoyl-L-alanyl-D-glutamate--2,6-diaminopimelate ligase
VNAADAYSTGAAMRLPALLHGMTAAPVPDLRIEDVALDSRQVRPGGLFLACRGDRQHGLAHLADAIAAGALAVAYESDQAVGLADELPAPVPLIAVDRLGARASLIADRFFGAPSRVLDVTGITGTNGKTTVSWLLARAIGRLGRRCGLIGTLGTGFADALNAGELTTPDAVTTQRALAGLRDQAASAVAMEVSSHALVQHRVRGVRFSTAVFTNLSRDHLDYHGNMETYGNAKALLFTDCAPARAVINSDDAFATELLPRLSARTKVITVGRRAPPRGPAHGCRHLAIGNISPRLDGLDVEVSGDFGHARLHLPLIGGFNAANAALVVAVLLAGGDELDAACDALRDVDAPPGRMQRAGGAGLAPLVVVDYAHTPDALAHTLDALRAHTSGRVICVFGCGGERDVGKRALMGEVASGRADAIVLTDDNPRGESPEAIVGDIVAGVPSPQAVLIEHDRRRAIRLAIGMATPQDVVLVAGKGHEAYQQRGIKRVPFSDYAEVRAALAAPASAGAGGGA